MTSRHGSRYAVKNAEGNQGWAAEPGCDHAPAQALQAIQTAIEGGHKTANIEARLAGPEPDKSMALGDIIAVGPMSDPEKPPHSFVIIGRRRVWQVWGLRWRAALCSNVK
jgi:hypothetical protein